MNDCKSERAAAAVAQYHIMRATQILSAAYEISEITGIAYRRSLTMAIDALGHAYEAIEIQTTEVTHG